MGNVLGSEKTKFNKHTSTNTLLQTPPRTPTLNATAVQTLASKIRDIHHALAELPDLRPGDKVNTLLTRLVSLCVIPYSSEFINYFFNIDEMHVLCEKLRPLCATAEGELERFWASKIVDESSRSRGTSITTTHIPRDPRVCRLNTSLTSSSNATPNPSPPQHLPLPPKLYRPLPHRMRHPFRLPTFTNNTTSEHRVHWLRTPSSHLAMHPRRLPDRARAQHRPRHRSALY